MSTATIVVIDDTPSICELVDMVLTEDGYTVVCYTDSTTAWTHLAQGHIVPDLIMMDLAMPRLGGTELRANIQQVPALATIPVVLMTAHPRHKVEALNTYGDAVLRKPFNLDELLALVVRLTRSATGLDRTA